MISLEKRIAVLEQANPAADVMTIIRRIVSPGHLDSEINCLRDDDGRLWTRQTVETEGELIDRATLEVKRSPQGVARLRAYSSRRVARQVMMPHAKCSMAKKVSGNFSHRTKIRRKRFIQL